MALTLADTLKQNVSAAAPQVQLGATEGAQRLLQTKATGKAVGPSTGPRISSQAEKSAASQAQGQLQKQQLQQQLSAKSQEQQMQQQEQKIETEARGILERAKTQRASYNTQADGLLQSFQRGERNLQDERDQMAVEVMAHNMRLGNDKYLHQLNMADKQLDLSNDLAWKVESAKSIIASDMENAYDVIDFNTFVKADARAFDEEISQMSMDTAQKLMTENIRQMNMESQYEGASGIFKGGISAWEKYGQEEEKETPSGYVRNKKTGMDEPVYG